MIGQMDQAIHKGVADSRMTTIQEAMPGSSTGTSGPQSQTAVTAYFTSKCSLPSVFAWIWSTAWGHGIPDAGSHLSASFRIYGAGSPAGRQVFTGVSPPCLAGWLGLYVLGKAAYYCG